MKLITQGMTIKQSQILARLYNRAGSALNVNSAVKNEIVHQETL